MGILYINSSARTKPSNSRAIGDYLVDRLGDSAVRRDLGREPLPPISGDDLIGVHGSQAANRESLEQQLALSEQLIEELRQSNTLVISTAMYNFGIPVVLKQWIDSICRAGISFQYTEQGPVGLLGVKRAYIITASGGTPIGSEMDFASPYLEHICRFIGIEEIFHIDAGGSKGEPEQVIEYGKLQVDQLIVKTSTPQLEEIV
ncbi:MAG: NAD(P)H-dependent oxidoreductase [Pseudomonadota bacterium]|nr:NAD(P)H-dependent oxidoreductase [Pseudomonadota bacterium]